jgi:hypothetical protein
MLNQLQNVQTYQMANLAFLQNLNCFVATCNTRFKDFDKIVANLGDTVTYDLPPRFVTNPGLVATFQGAEQRVRSITVGNALNTSYAFTAQQFIFNADRYMERFGEAAVYELSAQIEANVAATIISNTYRFYGGGINPINSYGQLSEALAYYRNYGSPRDKVKCYLSDIAVPQIINSGLNQFVVDRNEQIANSWMVGSYDDAMFYRSNFLPIQNAGTVGNDALTLTVVSINAAGTQITFSGANVSDPNSIAQYDKFQFSDNVTGFPNLRYLTFIGHIPSANPVQFQATAAAGSNGAGDVVVNVYPPLISTIGDPNQNLNTPIVAGMQVTVLPTHREGLIVGGDAFFLAMPQLPTQDPFLTANHVDPETGVSIRLTHGATFGQNQMGQILDCIWGQDLTPEYAMAFIFPV